MRSGIRSGMKSGVRGAGGVGATPGGHGRLRAMPRYFLDSGDGDTFLADEEGVELDSIEAAQDQATMALAELARDVLPGSTRRGLVIEVRDDNRAVLRVTLVFEAQLLDG